MKNQPHFATRPDPAVAIQVSIAKLARSGGVVSRDAATRRKLRMQSVQDYFYGPQKSLCPHSQTFSFREVRIFRCGGGPVAPSSALPLDSVRRLDPDKLADVDPNIDGPAPLCDLCL